jgi:hypothetical protein
MVSYDNAVVTLVIYLFYTHLCGNRFSSRALDTVASSNIALPEQSDFILGKSAHDRVQHTAVVEENKVALLPVLRIHILGRDTRALNVVADLADLLKIVNDSAILQVQLPHRRRMDLDRQTAVKKVLPAHRQSLDLLLLDLRQIIEWDLQALTEHTQARRSGLGAAHPDVRMRRIFDLRRARKLLLLLRKDVVHGVAGDESRRAERNVEFVARAVIVAADLAAAGGDLDCEEGGDDRWVEAVQRCVDVPSIEAGEVQIILLGDDALVEGLVVRVLELDVLEALILGHETVADDLYLRLVRDGLQVRVQDTALSIQRLAMPIAGSLRIEALSELELSFW